MASVRATNGKLTVRAHRGDAKTLLAFNLSKARTRRLAGFTIQVQPEGQAPYFLLNDLQFRKPADHAQDPTLPASSSINAPFHKFRWLHVPGSANQGTEPVFGRYRYTVTPRYFGDERSMLPLDPALSVSVSVDVGPFVKKGLSLGFTRGFTQSQAFVRHFGLRALVRPKGDDCSSTRRRSRASTPRASAYTYAEEYGWLGFTAPDRPTSRWAKSRTATTCWRSTTDVATVFALEALALVDHFHFLNKVSERPDARQGSTGATRTPPATRREAALSAGWFLSTTDRWAQPYFDPTDLHSVDRRLFA